jgi:SAM-dependent methyltransferase
MKAHCDPRQAEITQMNLNESTEISVCRGCDSQRLVEVLNLGDQPLANRLLKSPQEFDQEECYPLKLMVCDQCKLMQLAHTVKPELLFFDYPYFTSMSRTYRTHLETSAGRYIREFRLTKESRVLEVASNDGSFLKHFVEAGIPCLGVEPAETVAVAAEASGVTTLVKFFGAELAEDLVADGWQSDLVLANNILAHVPDLRGFVHGLAKVLKPNGRIIAEFPYGVDFIRNCEFDTIYHEHVFYFTLLPLLKIFSEFGLRVQKVERLPLHGGSIRLFAGHKRCCDIQVSEMSQMLVDEFNGLDYRRFNAMAMDSIRQVSSRVKRWRHEGRTIACYGAAAKGHSLLNAAGLDDADIDFIADVTPSKWGKYSPGGHIPIVPTDELAKRQPDYVLLLAWNWRREVLEREGEYIKEHGQFLMPLWGRGFDSEIET